MCQITKEAWKTFAGGEDDTGFEKTPVASEMLLMEFRSSLVSTSASSSWGFDSEDGLTPKSSTSATSSEQLPIGTYIVYLEPDPHSEFSREVNHARDLVNASYGPDESQLYPLHCTLTSFFTIGAAEDESPARMARGRSHSGLSDCRSCGSSMTTTASSVLEAGEQEDPLSLAWKPLFWPPIGVEPPHTGGWETWVSVVEGRLAESLRIFATGAGLESGVGIESRGAGLYRMEEPCYEFERPSKVMCLKDSNVILPWNWNWWSDDSLGGANRLKNLSSTIKENLVPAGCAIYDSRRMSGSSGISPKKRLHTTLVNWKSEACGGPQRGPDHLEKICKMFDERLERLGEKEVFWNLTINKVVKWGCLNDDRRHQFARVVCVENFARCQRT